MIGTVMYECLYGNIPDIFRSYFQRNADVHAHNIRNVKDLYVPYGRLDIRKHSIKIVGSHLWNYFPLFVKNAETFHICKKNMRHYLTERKGTPKGIISSLSPSEAYTRQWKRSGSQDQFM